MVDFRPQNVLPEFFFWCSYISMAHAPRQFVMHDHSRIRKYTVGTVSCTPAQNGVRASQEIVSRAKRTPTFTESNMAPYKVIKVKRVS